ncbi:USO1 [[Candida] subhashii]|uniref:USO1 n=1 Tax=[Candida] subhashii TaxID=561895 RepID=A0A8J5UWW1_9ASCO|nr:USO1 [[Candida] subhashii]KAG7661954.1 USO1 [[Candida] subhashii]
MGYINNILGQSNQAQSVEEAIPTLCDRLQHGSLSADRRAAVLGLKSFSRQYRELVAEYGLRPLIATMKRDSDNATIIKSILETILILFIRGEESTSGDSHTEIVMNTTGWISQQSRVQNGKYPSPLLMEDISLDQLSMWIADEFTQDQEILKVLIDQLLENDYHLRLYTIQLLESLVSTRGSRIKDAFLNIPTAMSSMCSLLDDPNEPVRNEAILLLMALANDNFNIQKLIAFENTFEKLFDVIEEEGGIRGSILVQDCLTLITNLLQFNASNQKFFLETKCVSRLAVLLSEPIEESPIQDENQGMDENGFPFPPPIIWTEQRLQNMIIALEICRLLVSEDNELVVANQNNLFQQGIHYVVLKLVFSPVMDNRIRSIALLTAADAISGNPNIQYEFSQFDIPYIDPSLPSVQAVYDGLIPVPFALLNWCLYINSVHAFDIRVGAACCLRAYFKDNKESKQAFLNDQINAYNIPDYFENLQKKSQMQHDHPEEAPPVENNENVRSNPTVYGNIFRTLMDYDAEVHLNPYKVWFASLVLMCLITDEVNDIKEIARGVKTGNEESGEEVMTCIQAISGLLVAALEKKSDQQRIAIGYLMLLTVWLWEDFDAVNDFLSDSSNIKSILTFLSNSDTSYGNNDVIIHGMATILIGTVYEFSSSKSPMSRMDLYSLVNKSLGKDNYSLKIKQFITSLEFKQFEDLSMFSGKKDDTGLPDVYFDSIYIGLIKENFPRIKRALFHDPLAEPRAKISYDLFEELDGKVTELTQDLLKEKQNAKDNDADLNSKIAELNALITELQNKLQNMEIELIKAREEHASVNENFTVTSETLAAMESSKKEYEVASQKYFRELQDARKKLSSSEDSIKHLQAKLDETESAKKKLEDGINNMTRDLFQLKKQKDEAEAKMKKIERDVKNSSGDLDKSKKTYETQIQRLRAENEEYKSRIEKANSRLNDFTKDTEVKINDLNEKLADSEANNEHLMDKLRSAAVAFQELRSRSQSVEPTLSTSSKLDEDAEKKLKELQLELEQSNKEKSDLQNELDEVKQTAKNDIAHLKLEIIDIQEVNDDIASEKQELEDKFQELKLELEKTAGDIELLKKESETTIAELRAEIDRLQSQLIIASQNGEDRSSVVSEMESASNGKNVDVLQKESSTNNNESSEEVISKINEIKELKEAHSREKSEIELKVSELQSELTKLSSEYSASQDELAKRADKNLDLKLQIEEYEDRIVELENLLKADDKMGTLSETLSALKLEKNKFETELFEKSTMVEELKAQLEKKESELKKVAIAIAALEEDKRHQIQEMGKQMENLKSSSEESINDLQELVEELRSENDTVIKTLKDRAYDLHSEKMALSVTLDKERKNAESTIAKLNEEINSLASSLKENEARVTELEESLQSVQTDFESKSQELSAAQDEVLRLSTELTQSINDFAALEQAHQLLEEELYTASENLSAKSIKMENMERSSANLNESLKTLMEELNRVRTRYDHDSEVWRKQKTELINDFTNQLNEKTREIEKARSVIASGSENSVIEEYAEKIRELEDKLESNKSEHDTWQDENSELEEQIKQLRSDLESREHLINEKSSELEELKLELESTNDSVETKESEIEGLNETIQQLQNELRNMGEELDTMKKKNEDLVLEISKQEEELVHVKDLLESKSVELNNLSSQALSGKLEVDVEELEAKVESLTVEKQQLSSLVTEKENEVVLCNEKIEDITSELEKVKAEYHESVESLEHMKNELDEKSSLLIKLQVELETKTKEKIEIDELVKLKSDEAQKFEQMLTKVTEESNDYQDIIKKLESELDTLKESTEAEKVGAENVAELQNSVELKATECAELETSKNELERELVETKERIQELITSNTSLEESSSKLASLENELEQANQQIEVLETEKHELVQRLEKIQQEYRELDAQSAKNEESAAAEVDTRHALSIVQEELHQANSEIEQLQNVAKENKDLQNRLEKFESLNEKVNEELHTLRFENDEMQVLLANERSENKQLTQQLIQQHDTDRHEQEIKKLKDKLSDSVPRSDLDDLMLLMSDLDEKNNKYKKRLKMLGQVVSSDEEDSDDEDGDDGDEEEEEDLL